MKKILLLLTIFLTGNFVFAQTQRLVLSEEFTGETCPPCATYNPAFNALLNANPTKVVSIKYQNDIPSVGPQIYKYNTVDVEARQTYYTNGSSPSVHVDGGAGTHPNSVTQTTINNRYAVPSNFSMTATHTLSPGLDSIYARVVVRAAQTITAMSSLYLQIVVIEREIWGYTSPNGESSYEGVLRKMLPTAAGTLLQANWNTGDSVVTNVAWKIAPPPAGVTVIPIPKELAIVAFVQNNANKQVQQATYSPPLVANDAGVTAITGLDAITCNPSVNIVATIHNYAPTNLTSVDVTLQVDAGPVQNFPWTGNIASGGQQTFNIPTQTLAIGNHTLVVGTANPNGNPDDVSTNNNMTVTAAIMGNPVSAPLIQQFTLVTFPPSGYLLENVSGAYTWTRVTAGLPSYSAKINFYLETAGGTDNFYTPMINFSSANSSAALDFDYSYAQYSNESDLLMISVSTDCGVNWTPVFVESGATLATHAPQTTAYTPASAADWQHVTVSLAAYAGQPDILLQFQTVSDYGNNLYIDNINITDGTTGTNDLFAFGQGISVYPNPSNGEINFAYNFPTTQNIAITVSDVLGSTVKAFELNNVSSGKLPINMADVAKGSYLVTVRSNDAVVVKKITITD
jgi:hypothetical protein